MYLSPHMHRGLVEARSADLRADADRRRFTRRRRRPPRNVGEQFVHSLAARDRDRLLDVLHPELDFRALEENRFFRASSAQQLVDELLFDQWFDASDGIEVEGIAHDAVGGRARLRYRLRVTRPEHIFRVDHRAYIDVRDERISWMSVMCSGRRPLK